MIVAKKAVCWNCLSDFERKEYRLFQQSKSSDKLMSELMR